MISQNVIKINAIAAIQNEGNAILNLQNFVNEQFIHIVSLIAETKGRLVCSGIGKSAIIAQKIVATLNSTGTAAVFMHAADAIHGDLGMIQQNDIVLIISKSGESPEIKVLLPLVKNFGNPTIGMVGNMESFLATHSDYVINTTIGEEACPNNLAPTTSTTAQMVMGDVLAISLMNVKNFKSEHFAKYHPGGALGKKLYLTAGDLINNNLKPQVSEQALWNELIFEISSKRLGATVVVDEQQMVKGIITDGDLRRAMEKIIDTKNAIADQIMSVKVKTVYTNTLAIDTLQLMKENDITQVVVVNEDHTYAGIVHIHDLIKEGIL